MTDEDTSGLTAVLVSSVPALKDPPDRLRRIAERVQVRRRRQATLAVASVVAVGAITVAGIPLLNSALRQERSELAAPTATSITSVDWTQVTLTLPTNAATPCPTGPQRVRRTHEPRYGEVGEVTSNTSAGRRTFQVLNSPAAIGDLTGDGKPEALMHIRCTEFPSGGMGDDEGGQLLAVTMRDDHTLVGLGYVGQIHAQYPSYRIAAGRVVAQLRYQVIDGSNRGYSQYDLAHVREYSWDGKGFTQVAGRTQPLVLMPAKDGLSSPVRLPAVLRNNSPACPAATATFSFGAAKVGAYTYSIEGRGNAHVVDIDKDGNDEVLVAVRCRGNGYDATSLYLLGQGAAGLVTRDVPLANDGSHTIGDVTLQGTTLVLQVTENGAPRTLTMPWDGKQFSERIGHFTN